MTNLTPEAVAELAAKGTQGEWVKDADGYTITANDCIILEAFWDDIGSPKEAEANQQRAANVPAMEALIAEQAAQLKEQSYTYVGKDGKPRLARDMEDELEAAKARIAELEGVLTRQGDNLAFILNHMTIPDSYYDKFTAELEEDRAALQGEQQ